MKGNKMIKEVKRTKYPTSKQISSMALNLKEKYKNKHVSIEWRFSVYRILIIHLFIYIEDLICQDHLTWEECQDKYFSLMKG